MCTIVGQDLLKCGVSGALGKVKCVRNMAYPENANFKSCVPSILKFHTFYGLHQTKKC